MLLALQISDLLLLAHWVGFTPGAVELQFVLQTLDLLLVFQLIELLLCLIQLGLRLSQVGCLLLKTIKFLLSAIELLVALEILQLLVALQFLDLLVLFGFVEILSDLLGLFSRAHNAWHLQKYAATNRQQQTAMSFHIEKLSLALRNCKMPY